MSFLKVKNYLSSLKMKLRGQEYTDKTERQTAVPLREFGPVVLKRLVDSHPDLWENPQRWLNQYAPELSSSIQPGQRVLIPTSTGAHKAVLTVESLLGVALKLRGAEVEYLLCDEALPACLMSVSTDGPIEKFADHGPRETKCKTCFKASLPMYEGLGFKVNRYSDCLTAENRRSIREILASTNFDEKRSYRWGNLAIGEHAWAGALRYFAKAELHDEPLAEKIFVRYFEASLISAMVTKNLLSQKKFDVAAFHHGIYVPQGLVGEVCRALNVRVANWVVAYRSKCLIFSHDDTYHHTLLTEPVSQWDQIQLNPLIRDKISSYLRSRWEGTQDWIWFHEKPNHDFDKVRNEIGIDSSKPCIGLLTNVMWDAQLHYPANAFKNMLEWVITSIQHFANRNDVQLLIRVHPAEIRGTVPSRQPIVAEIKKAFPELPKNVILLGPESPVSTYAAMAACDSVLIYGTKTGVELSSMGIPVVVAGEAWIRNKGLTQDATSPESYNRILESLPTGKRSPPEMIDRALKYAFHFFFRRMIEVSSISAAPSKGAPFSLDVSSLEDLLPGNDLGLDVICDGILKRTPFVYPYENLLTSDVPAPRPPVMEAR